MVATLTFNLPEEKTQHEESMYGSNYASAIRENLNYIRSQIKYREELTPREIQILEDVRNNLIGSLEGVPFEY